MDTLEYDWNNKPLIKEKIEALHWFIRGRCDNGIIRLRTTSEIASTFYTMSEDYFERREFSFFHTIELKVDNTIPQDTVQLETNNRVVTTIIVQNFRSKK